MQPYYSMLATDEQRYAYESIRNALESKAAYANVRCDTSPDEVYEAVLMDNPLCRVAHPSVVCRYDGRCFAFEYIDVDENLFFTKLDKIENEVRRVCEKERSSSDYSVYKAIFDVLSERIVYDIDVFQEYEDLKRRGARKSVGALQADKERFLRRYGISFSPYGALVKKKAVCNGIASLFKIVCDRFGLPCACVQACSVVADRRHYYTEIDDDTVCNHLLNVIEIDGQQAFVDLTNSLVTESLPLTSYDFFAVNYSVLSKSYLLRPRDLRIFNCNGVDGEFFARNELVFSSVDKVRRYLTSYISKFSEGKIRLYYNGGKFDDNELSRMCEDIISSHCSATKCPSGIRCNNGFLSCAIIDN